MRILVGAKLWRYVCDKKKFVKILSGDKDKHIGILIVGRYEVLSELDDPCLNFFDCVVL